MNDVVPKSPLAITWAEKLVKVSDLKPYERNPRFMGKEEFFKLKKSLRETGYHSRIKATIDLRIVGGHYRQRALQALGINEILVLVPDRALTDDEFRRVMIQDNVNFGRFDTDMLATDFETEELTDWGVSDSLIGELDDPNETGEEDTGEEKEDKSTQITCPKCGHIFQAVQEDK